MPPKDPIKTKLDKLAEKIADHALAPDTLNDDRLEAFKLLTGYYTGTVKYKPKENDDNPKGESFDDWQQSTQASGRRPSRGGHA